MLQTKYPHKFLENIHINLLNKPGFILLKTPTS